MKLNSVQKNMIYPNPQVKRTRKLIPKEVQSSQQTPSFKRTRENGQKASATTFSAVAEKVLSGPEKKEIRRQFPESAAPPIAYSRRGKIAVKNGILGQKIDLKG